MAKRSLLAGSTSRIEYVFIQDVNGSPITGLVYNSTSLAAKYVLAQAASVAITLATQTVTGAWSSGGFVEIDATAMPGVYRLDVPNAAIASGDKSIVSLYGYTGMRATLIEYDLWAVNPQDATAFGLSRIDGAITSRMATFTLPTNFSSFSIDGSGRVDAGKLSGTSLTGRDIGASVLLSAGTGTGQLDFTSGVVKANLAQILGTALTETAGLLAGGFKKFFNIATPASTMDALTLVATATNLTNAPTAGDFTSTMKTSLNAATPAVTVSDKTGYSLTSAYDPAKTASQAGDAMALTSGERTTLTAVIWAALTSGLTTVGSIGKRLVDYVTGDTYARLGAPAGASVSADVAAVKVDTAAIKLKTDNLPASPAAVGSAMTLTAAYDAAKTAAQAGDAMALTSGERNSTAAALLDLANGIETGVTPRQAARLQLAALAGKLSGAAGTTVTIRDTNDSKDRIVATVDSNGNRTAVTLDAS